MPQKEQQLSPAQGQQLQNKQFLPGQCPESTRCTRHRLRARARLTRVHCQETGFAAQSVLRGILNTAIAGASYTQHQGQKGARASRETCPTLCLFPITSSASGRCCSKHQTFTAPSQTVLLLCCRTILAPINLLTTPKKYRYMEGGRNQCRGWWCVWGQAATPAAAELTLCPRRDASRLHPAVSHHSSSAKGAEHTQQQLLCN